MLCFADATTEYGGWVAAGVLLIGAIAKLIIDLSKNRFDQSQVDRDKTVAGLEKVIEHTRLDYDRLERKSTDQDRRIERLLAMHNNCELQRARDVARIEHLERELVRNEIDFVPYKPDGSGPHLPLSPEVSHDV